MKTKISKYSNQHKLLLNIDWLTLNVEDNFIHFNDSPGTFKIDDLLIEKVDKQTSHFKQMCYVWHEKHKIAVITYDSRSNLILKGRAHIKFENHLFYSGELFNYYQKIKTSFNLNTITISRIDLAVDGVNFHEFVTKYEIEKQKQKYFGKSREIGYFRHDDRNNVNPVGTTFQSIATNIFDSFTVGSYGSKSTNTGKSCRFIRYYNKTKELEDKQHKKYISEYFEKNSFKGTVYRFEIELRSEFLSQIQGFQIDSIFNIETLSMLFRSSLKNFFEWRKKDDINVSRCTSIELFETISQPQFIRVKKEVNKTLRPIQQMIKRLIFDSVECLSDKTNSKIVLANNYLTTIRVLVNEYNLKEWLSYKWSYLVEELQKYMNIHFSTLYKIPEYQLKLNYYGA